MGNMVLSAMLAAAGWIKVLGRYETYAGHPSKVEAGTPHTWDSNNATVVVYDENGYPWVLPKHKLGTQLSGFRLFTHHRGAYVPFSNDGGSGIRQLFPRFYSRDGHPLINVGQGSR